MRLIVTGAAGFIGSHLVDRLLKRGDLVLGIDNHNAYYDPRIKEARLRRFADLPGYDHHRIDLCDRDALSACFENFRPQVVVNLAAQAGVRYSIENPFAYINSNIVGFANILELSREFKIKHLVYASSSSVYGGNEEFPFSEGHQVDHPLSLYAASKKSNELMAHAYSHLFELPSTGLRFFTVYGPWGRPDMALFKFTKAILKREPIQLYNYGNHRRDFTYIDDIIDGVLRVVDHPAECNPARPGSKLRANSSKAPWSIYNIGNSKPVSIREVVSVLEGLLEEKAIVELLPLQAGDVPDTHSDITAINGDLGYTPRTTITEGVTKFIEWYLDYYGK